MDKPCYTTDKNLSRGSEGGNSPMRRRDNKGRILQPGESQLASGKYRYRYVDAMGNRKDVYSWRLKDTDPVPSGRRKEQALREREKQIEKLLLQGIISVDMTVNELVERYVSIKTGATHNTKSGYITVQNLLAKEPFGNRRIDQIKTSDAKLFLIRLQKTLGKGYSTIQNVRGVLRPAFQMAVDDDLLLKNPFGFELHTVVVNDSKKREAISLEDQTRFLQFVESDSHYHIYADAFELLFLTGLRISEFCGLTVKDIDFEKKMIHVNKQLQRNRNMEYLIVPTKTTSGTRDIPMTDRVEVILRRIVNNRAKVRREPIIKGVTGFLYLDKNGKPLVAQHWEKYMQLAREKYDRTHEVPLPLITPHVCRHTFCTQMAMRSISPKALQYLMGHSEVNVTLNTYTHSGPDYARAELVRLREITG